MLISYIIRTSLSAALIRSQDADIGKAVSPLSSKTYFCYPIVLVSLLQAYTVEIYPYTLRGRGLSFLYLAGVSVLVTANQVNPAILGKIDWKYYVVFCRILAFLVVVIWFLFPETEAFTLEEI